MRAPLLRIGEPRPSGAMPPQGRSRDAEDGMEKVTDIMELMDMGGGAAPERGRKRKKRWLVA